MTGITLAEYNFALDNTEQFSTNTDLIQQITQTIVDSKLKRSVPLFEAAKDPVLTKVENLQIRNDIRTVDTLTKMRSVLSEPGLESKRLLTPKMFDRILNVFCDPDDFEIDIEETLKSEQGKESFNKLFQQGIIYEVKNQQSGNDISNSIKKYKMIQRTSKENHVVFEKYFATIETIEPDIADNSSEKTLTRSRVLS